MPATNPADYYSPTAHRFQAWMALTVFSTVCLSAAITTFTGSRSAAENWCLAVSILSMLSAMASTVCYLTARTFFVSQRPEHVSVLFLVILWSAGLPVMMNPAYNIALSAEDGSIRNANLYFFSWLSLAAVLYLTGSCIQEATGHDITETATDKWYGLSLSSIVVLGSSVRAFQTADCSAVGGQEYCKRTQLAIAVGSISIVVAAVMTGLLHASRQVALRVEMAVTTLLLVLWCFGVGYVTFGNTPGSSISNLYFSTWISFIFSVFLFARNFRQTLAARELQQQNKRDDDPPDVEPQSTAEDDD